MVVGAKFELTRPIYVLDTTRFEAPMKPLSIFSKDYLGRVEQWSFMNTFARQIARPISPNDEHLDYIPTQAVAEYLLHHHSFKRDGQPAKIEGIVFQSAQLPPNKNIVLLGDAAQVRGPVPSKKKRSPSDADFFSDTFMSVFEQAHSYNPGLSLSADPVEVLRVTGARFASDAYLWRSSLDSRD
ncbi:RES domain protein [compost metagenome]